MADGNSMQITTKVTPRSVTETTSRLTDILAAKGLKGLRCDRPECRGEPGRRRDGAGAGAGLRPPVARGMLGRPPATGQRAGTEATSSAIGAARSISCRAGRCRRTRNYRTRSPWSRGSARCIWSCCTATARRPGPDHDKDGDPGAAAHLRTRLVRPRRAFCRRPATSPGSEAQWKLFGRICGLSRPIYGALCKTPPPRVPDLRRCVREAGFCISLTI